MKKFLASLLITLMVVTPALACCCNDSLPKAGSTHLEHQDHHASARHDHHTDVGQSSHDCSKADFQKTHNVADVQTKNLKIKTAIDPVAALGNHDLFLSWIEKDNSRSIPFRNEPPDPSLPIYLTTQRLRI